MSAEIDKVKIKGIIRRRKKVFFNDFYADFFCRRGYRLCPSLCLSIRGDDHC